MSMSRDVAVPKRLCKLRAELSAGTRPMLLPTIHTLGQLQPFGHVAAALAQTYQPLEIIISDDCSSDRTFAIVEEVCRSYSGRSTTFTVNNIRE